MNNIEDCYHYGYNGQIKVNEIAGLGNHNTALYWEYDTRTGRRWNQDPVTKEWESPYLCFSGNPIMINDKNGDDGKTAAVIAIATQEAAGVAAATGVGVVAVPFIEVFGDALALYEWLTDLPAAVSAVPKPLPPPAPTNQQAAVRKADSKDVEKNASSANKSAAKANPKKEVGSYTTEHESGKKYHGKGPEGRAKQSGNEKAKDNKDPVKKTDWKPSTDDREAFKDEATRIRNDGGVKNENNYNKNESPGEKYLKQDGEH